MKLSFLFPKFISFALTSFFPINSLAFAFDTTNFAILSVIRAISWACVAIAAFFCVCWSKLFTASFICSIPLSCYLLDISISEIRFMV